MEKDMTLDNIRIDGNHRVFDENGNCRGEILYEYVRGSKCYHTDTETSDEDHGGIYIMPDSTLTGLGFDYRSELKDTNGDSCFWEINRFMKLAASSNPTVLEALFVPDEMVIYEHPVIKELRKHRDMFITKQCFMPFGGYAISQIKKAQGQNKKIHWDMEKMTRKTPLDFCYTFRGQGSQPMDEWLKERGLEQRNCGLVNVPNMKNVYGVYYDFGQHFKLNGIRKEYFCNELNFGNPFNRYCFYERMRLGNGAEEVLNYEDIMELFWKDNEKPKGGYCGIMSGDGKSNEIRFVSVPKDERPICFMSYNAEGYASHCREYREYEDWKKHRNPARYESNLEGEKSGNPDMMYDSKNMMHCFRLMSMCKEIAEGKGVILDRTGIDRDFLLDVRNRKFGYGELMEMMLKLKDGMDEAISKSGIPEKMDPRAMDGMLLALRSGYRDMTGK